MASAAGGNDPPSLPHDDSAPKGLAIAWTLTALSAVFLALRLYCKLGRRRALWWDDYVLIASWILTCLGITMYTVIVPMGFGRHVWDVDPKGLASLGLLGNVGATASILATTTAKMSFGLTLIRLSERYMRYFIIFLVVTTDIFMAFTALAIWIRCTPAEKNWDAIVPGECSTVIGVNVGIASGVYSGVMDIVFAFIPWFIIWNLNKRPLEKIGIAFAMSLGILGGVAAFIKASKIPLLAGMDFTYILFDLIIWGHVEANVTIIAAAIPMLRVLLRGTVPYSKPSLRTWKASGVSDPTTTGTGVKSVDGTRFGSDGAERLPSRSPSDGANFRHDSIAIPETLAGIDVTTVGDRSSLTRHPAKAKMDAYELRDV